MVDVWEELGRAVGRALKPLAELASGVWKALGGAVGDLVGDLMGSARGIRDDQKPTITGLLPGVLEEATAALGEGSPPKEVKDAVDKLVKQLLEMVEKESKTEGKSLPTTVDLFARQAALTGGIIGMYAVTHAVSIALDASQPFKDWGFKTAIMDMLYQFNSREVIGPMIQAPIWSSVITPLRMRMNEQYPYQVPGTGVLPYLRWKGIITDEEYKLNMKFHALDEDWAEDMLENTARYPDFSDLRTMIHRGAKTWEDAKKALQMSLIQADYLDAYKELLPMIPGSGDLITMMVREVIPREDFVKYMKLQGWSEEWAGYYYENHWILLPLGEVRTARHRGLISDAEIDKFLVLHDYKPEPRPGIMTADRDLAAKMVWNLPGRIDARWLFRWNEIDVSGLRDLLIKGGLDPEWADRVATATAKNQFLSEITRQVTNIKADFAKGYSNEATMRRDLTALGISPALVEYHVTDALADRERDMRDEELRMLKAQYARGAVTMAQVVARAEEIIVDEDVRRSWLEALPQAKEEQAVGETYTADINRLVANAKGDYVKGYIGKEDLVSRLGLLGLPDQVVEYHVMDADEDRERKRNDERLVVIKDMWMKDVETDFSVIEGWVEKIIVDEEARALWLDDAYFDKLKTVTR